MAYFTQTAHDLSPKGYGRIKSITVRVCVTDCTGAVYITDMLLQGGSIATGWVGHVSDCTGRIWFTDLMVQEGDRLTGFVINTETQLQKYREDGAIVPPRFYNGIVRSSGTVVIFNLGSTTAGLDIEVEPIQDMETGSIVISQGAGSHKATFLDAASAGDTFSLLASTRECLRNGAATNKDGFYQYSAAGDSKHPITLEKGKSAKLYIKFQEMQDGGEML